MADSGWDLLHPLATLHWEECSRLSESVRITSECVLWKGKLYVGVVDKPTPTPDQLPVKKTPQLLQLSSDLTSWRVVGIVPTPYSALTTFRSQLVLVGGRDNKLSEPTNELWMSDDGSQWHSFLPSMPTKRFFPAAINTGSPECLVVAGGMVTFGTAVDAVEVLVGERWFALQPLPLKYYDIRHTLHNGSLFLTGQHWKRIQQLPQSITYCRLEDLVSACQSADCTGDDRAEIWKYADTSPPHRQGKPLTARSVSSYCQHLIITGAGELNKPILYVYSPHLPAWLHVGCMKEWLYFMTATVESSGSLLFIGEAVQGVASTDCLMAFKVSVKVSPYNPDAEVSVSALERLEAAGVSVLTSMAQNLKQLAKICKVFVNLKDKKSTPVRKVLDLICTWQQSTSVTWNLLYVVLKELGLEDLGEQIAEYLSTPPSLKSRCVSVIVSALLRQSTRTLLEADQLRARLPDYVPSSVKSSILHSFKAHTHQLFETKRLPFLHRSKRAEKDEEEKAIDYDISGLELN